MMLSNTSRAMPAVETVGNASSRHSVSVQSQSLHEKLLLSNCNHSRGYAGRYCEVSLHEQCGSFPSMTGIDIDCVQCVCYNGLFMCDTTPMGLCRTLFAQESFARTSPLRCRPKVESRTQPFDAHSASIQNDPRALQEHSVIRAHDAVQCHRG